MWIAQLNIGHKNTYLVCTLRNFLGYRNSMANFMASNYKHFFISSDRTK